MSSGTIARGVSGAVCNSCLGVPSHLRPVAAVHSDVPEVQSTEFASLPSVVIQTVVGKRRFDTGIELDPSTEPCFGTLSTELVYIEACSKLTPIAYGSKGGSECIACATGNLDEPRFCMS